MLTFANVICIVTFDSETQRWWLSEMWETWAAFETQPMSSHMRALAQCVLNCVCFPCSPQSMCCVTIGVHFFFFENHICTYVYIYTPESANNSAGLIFCLWWGASPGFIQNLVIQSFCTTCLADHLQQLRHCRTIDLV